MGNGLYIKAALTGLFKHPQIPSQIRNQLNERLATQSLDTLYEELKQVDECFALSISRNDKQRIQRGLEIHLATGIPISEHWKAQKHDQTTCPSKS